MKKDKRLVQIVNHQELDEYVFMFSTVIPNRDAVYVSTPITSGLRFVSWFDSNGGNIKRQFGRESIEYEREHKKHVIIPNVEEGKKIVDRTRKNSNSFVIDPTQLEHTGWSQEEYRYLWGRVVELYVREIIMVNGWEYSSGCSYEFLTAVGNNIPVLNENNEPISIKQGFDCLGTAINWYNKHDVDTDLLKDVYTQLGTLYGLSSIESNNTISLSSEDLVDVDLGDNVKDTVLNSLAVDGNIAQFISFSSGEANIRYIRVRDIESDCHFDSVGDAITNLCLKSLAGTVNVRSFDPIKREKSGNFHYGCDNKQAANLVKKNAKTGFYSIVNETIDVNDGGVSGVVLGDLMEFAPEQTPRCVEDPRVCSLNRRLGMQILSTIYGFRPAVNYPSDIRVEFSIHPQRRGIRNNHTIIWELKRFDKLPVVNFEHLWPNLFSEFLGDKLYGLIVADAVGLPVPQTKVITRKVGVFSFGQITPSHERWIRTCPARPAPGLYPTYKGWKDPFEMLKNVESELPDMIKNNPIMSVLDQANIEGKYSGVADWNATDNKSIIEGVAGHGDLFMLGQISPQKLPNSVRKDVEAIHEKAVTKLGSVRIEWVHDGRLVWIVQLQRSSYKGTNDIIVNGHPSNFIRFETKDKRIEDLYEIVKDAKKSDSGIILVGNIGILSHFGDLLRKESVPSRLERLTNS
jgi:hypothetical protein